MSGLLASQNRFSRALTHPNLRAPMALS